MANSPLAPTTSCFMQGGQYLKANFAVIVQDSFQNLIHRFPIADSGAIADQGEAYNVVQLDASNPSYIVDESLTGFTGATSAEDFDLIYILPSTPVFVKFGAGIDKNEDVAGSRNPNGALLDLRSGLLLKTNTISGLTLDTATDQRVLPLGIYLQDPATTALVTFYLAKFSR